MQIGWTDHDKDLYMSLKGAVNKGGYFSSVGQMNYMARVVGHNTNAKDGELSWGDSVPSAVGQSIVILEAPIIVEYAGSTPWAQGTTGWGRRSRAFCRAFVVDGVGVVAMYKIHRSYDDSTGSSGPNPKRTEVIFERDNSLAAEKLAELTAANDAKAKAIANAKAASNFIGEVGDRLDFQGTARLVWKGDNQWGTTYIYLIKTQDGNTIKYMGKWLGQGESFPISFKATVKKHEEYNGEKQTVVNRPMKIQVGEDA